MVEESLIEELENLEDFEEELDLESLIREGTDYNKHISIELPDGRVGGAIIKPLSSSDWDECVRRYRREKSSVKLLLSVCDKGLMNLKEEPYDYNVLKKFPAGVIMEISQKIMDISGIKQDKEKEGELRKELLDF